LVGRSEFAEPEPVVHAEDGDPPGPAVAGGDGPLQQDDRLDPAGELGSESFTEEPAADQGVGGPVELAVGPVPEAPPKRVADEQGPGQDGRPDRRPEPDRQVAPPVVRQAVEE